MKAKLNNVVELSSLDKLDTRRFLFNRTFIVGGFSMCSWSTLPVRPTTPPLHYSTLLSVQNNSNRRYA